VERVLDAESDDRTAMDDRNHQLWDWRMRHEAESPQLLYFFNSYYGTQVLPQCHLFCKSFKTRVNLSKGCLHEGHLPSFFAFFLNRSEYSGG